MVASVSRHATDDQRVGERIREGFKISIIGPTNVGKSSLLNHLANREVAIVSEIAGTTRDVIETHLNLDGYPVILSDTAGIRDSKDEIERKGIKLSLKNANDADLNIIVLEPKSVDFQSFLSALSQDKNIIVLNKLDKIDDKLNEEIRKLNPISISVKENKNIDTLPEPQTKKINLTSGNFYSEEVSIRPIDYYFSNPIARASKTMSDCRLEKIRNSENRKTG